MLKSPALFSLQMTLTACFTFSLHIYDLLSWRISYSVFRYENIHIYSAFESAFCSCYVFLKEFFLCSGSVSAFPLLENFCNHMWWWVLTELIMVIILQCTQISNHYIIYLKLKYCYTSVIPQKTPLLPYFIKSWHSWFSWKWTCCWCDVFSD